MVFIFCHKLSQKLQWGIITTELDLWHAKDRIQNRLTVCQAASLSALWYLLQSRDLSMLIYDMIANNLASPDMKYSRFQQFSTGTEYPLIWWTCLRMHQVPITLIDIPWMWDVWNSHRHVLGGWCIVACLIITDHTSFSSSASSSLASCNKTILSRVQSILGVVKIGVSLPLLPNVLCSMACEIVSGQEKTTDM